MRGATVASLEAWQTIFGAVGALAALVGLYVLVKQGPYPQPTSPQFVGPMDVPGGPPKF